MGEKYLNRSESRNMMILKTKPPFCDSRSEISRSLREMADRLEGAAIAAETDEEDD